MQEITGRLDSVGSSTIFHNTVNVYNTFEIGGRVLQKLRAARAMDDMLRDSLGEEVTVWICNKGIIALRRPDGRSYAMQEINRPGLGSLIVCIAAIPFWGIGLVFLWARHKVKKETRERDQVRAMLPGAIILEH